MTCFRTFAHGGPACKRPSCSRQRFKRLFQGWVLRQAREHLGKCLYGLGCAYLGLTGSESVNRIEQAANESWGQLGYPGPEPRPLGRDVTSPGHGCKSCTGRQSLSRGICASETVKSAGFQTLGRVAYTVRIRARRGAQAARQETSWT